jgi:hypothetical protein
VKGVAVQSRTFVGHDLITRTAGFGVSPEEVWAPWTKSEILSHDWLIMRVNATIRSGPLDAPLPAAR